MGIFHTIVSQPLLNLLVWFYDVLPGGSIGLAIIVLTILLRAILLPAYRKQLRSQKAMQDLQPKVAELKKKYADNKEKQAQEMMELYKNEKVNPLSSCLPLVLQGFILYGLFRVLINGLGVQNFDSLYGFVANPGHIDTMFLGINLAEPSILLAVLAGIVQYFQAKMMITRRAPSQVEATEGAKDENMMAAMNKSMVYFMPIITIVIGSRFPGGLALYWFVSNLFMVIQQYFLFKSAKDKLHQAT